MENAQLEALKLWLGKTRADRTRLCPAWEEEVKEERATRCSAAVRARGSPAHQLPVPQRPSGASGAAGDGDGHVQPRVQAGLWW